jgi:hypothetical protein
MLARILDRWVVLPHRKVRWQFAEKVLARASLRCFTFEYHESLAQGAWMRKPQLSLIFLHDSLASRLDHRHLGGSGKTAGNG